MLYKLIIFFNLLFVILAGKSQGNSLINAESKLFLSYLLDSIYHKQAALTSKGEKKKIILNRSTIPFSTKRLPQEIFDKEHNRVDTMGVTNQKNIILDLYKIIEQNENIIFPSMTFDKLRHEPEIDKIWVSQPIFLKKMSYCLIEIGSKGQGKIHLFKKENQKWSLSSTISEWIFHVIE